MTQIPVTDTFTGLSKVCPTSLPVQRSRSDPFTYLLQPAGEFFVPNIKSAKKDLRKARAAAVRNRAQRSTLRTAVKKAKTADAAAADRLTAVSLLDRAARKGLIHRNAAARLKSKLARAANAANAASAA